MTTLDIIVLLLLGGGAVYGFIRGFVHEILALAAWVLAFVAVWVFYEPAAAALGDVTGSEGGGSILSYALIFIITLVAGKLIAAYLGRMTRSSLLGPIDRALGFGFGGIKGILIASALFVLGTIVYETAYPRDERPEWITQSRTYPLLNATSNAVVDYVDERRGVQKDISE